MESLDPQFLSDLEKEARVRRWTWRIRYFKAPFILTVFLLALISLHCFLLNRGFRSDNKEIDEFADFWTLIIIIAPLTIHGYIVIPRLFTQCRRVITGLAEGYSPRALEIAFKYVERKSFFTQFRFALPISRIMRRFLYIFFSDDGIGAHVSPLEFKTLFRSIWWSRAFDSWLNRQSRPVDFNSYLAHFRCSLDTICGPFKFEPPIEPDSSDPIPIREEPPILALVPIAQILGLEIIRIQNHPRWSPLAGADGFRFDLSQLDRRRVLEITERIIDIRCRISGVSRDLYASNRTEKRIDDAIKQANLPTDWPKRPVWQMLRGGEWINCAPLTDLELIEFINAFLYFFYKRPWQWEPFDHICPIRSENGRIFPIHVTFTPDHELKIVKA